MSTMTIPTMNIADALRLVAEGSVLLDIREPFEWDAGHAPDAVHVPLGSLSSASLPDYRGRRVLVICRSGNRSLQATALLRMRGCDAYSVDGGMTAWQRVGAPVVSAAGTPGRIA